MQKQEDMNSFDLQVRQMLQDAQERPARSSWKAVCSRLDGGERRTAAFYWTRGAVGLAFAAMLAAGIFFAGTLRTPASPDIQVDRVAQMVESHEVIREKAIPVSNAASPSTYKASRSGKSIPSSAIMSSSEAAAEQIWKEQSWKDKAPEKKTVEKKEEQGVDVFAEMEREDMMAEIASAKKKRPSVYAGGILSSNNASSSSSWMGVDGITSSGLVRTGNESFGIPASLGIGVKYPLGSSRFSVGAGLSWSMLSSTFEGKYDGIQGDVRHTMHYIGIPVNAYFDLLATNAVKIYVYAGAQAEYCLSSSYAFHSSASSRNVSEAVKGLQYSIGAGLGLEFAVSPRIGLYIDPSFRNYFYSGHPTSVRTQQPQTFNFEAGLRFNL